MRIYGYETGTGKRRCLFWFYVGDNVGVIWERWAVVRLDVIVGCGRVG